MKIALIAHDKKKDEIIELAKAYEDEKARPFINGVLNAVKNDLAGDTSASETAE